MFRLGFNLFNLESVMNEKPVQVVGTPLHDWFGLSYASFLTLPRVLLESMPQEWQEKMSSLLRQYEEEFPGTDRDVDGIRVQCVKGRKLVKTPERIVNYRRPDLSWIASMRTP